MERECFRHSRYIARRNRRRAHPANRTPGSAVLRQSESRHHRKRIQVFRWQGQEVLKKISQPPIARADPIRISSVPDKTGGKPSRINFGFQKIPWTTPTNPPALLQQKAPARWPGLSHVLVLWMAWTFGAKCGASLDLMLRSGPELTCLPGPHSVKRKHA